MLEGEFEGAKVIHKYTPKGIPRPIACGSFKSDPNTHFYLCDFVDMKEELPDIGKFSKMLAKLHKKSMLDNDAPVQFGFDFMTYQGSMYQDISWCDTWEGMYSKRFQSFVDQERVSQGPSDELDEIVPQFKIKVIPRLLRPLVTHDRSIKPVALHGDLWSGNMDINSATEKPVYFDPSVFWGHHECRFCSKIDCISATAAYNYQMIYNACGRDTTGLVASGWTHTLSSSALRSRRGRLKIATFSTPCRSYLDSPFSS